MQFTSCAFLSKIYTLRYYDSLRTTYIIYIGHYLHKSAAPINMSDTYYIIWLTSSLQSPYLSFCIVFQLLSSALHFFFFFLNKNSADLFVYMSWSKTWSRATIFWNKNINNCYLISFVMPCSHSVWLQEKEVV